MPCICLLAALLVHQTPKTGRTPASPNRQVGPSGSAIGRVAPQISNPVFGFPQAPPVGRDQRDGAVTVSYACGKGVDEGAVIRLDDGHGHPIRLRFGLELAKSLGDPIRLIGVKARVIGKIDSSGTMDVESLTPTDPSQLSQPLDARMGLPKPKLDRVRALISGTHKYLTILVKYADSPNVTPFSNSFISYLFGPNFPSVDHYYKEASYNNFTVAGSQVIGWVNLPHVQSYYSSTTTGWGVDWDKITADAVAAVDSQVDFNDYYGFNVIPNVAMGNIGGLGGQRQFTLDGTTRLWGSTYDNPQNNMHALLTHEIGHTIGFPHSSGPYSQTYDSLWDIMSGGYYPNGDPVYQTLADATISYNRTIAGWIAPSRLFEALPGTDKTFRIERLCAPTNSTDYLMARIYISGSASHYYTVEARRYGGSYEVATSVPAEGILIHDVDEGRIVTDPFTGSTVQGRNAEVVDPDNNGNCNDAGATWIPGETYTDATAGISVAVLSSDSTGFNVRVKVDASKPNPYEITNTNDNGAGSFRNGLYYARNHPGSRVKFKMSVSDPNYSGGVFRIHALTYMPDLSADNTVVDGTDQTTLTGNTNPNGPEVFLDGTGTASGQTALWVSGSNVTVRGLAIGGWGGQGIVLDGGNGGHAATIAGNFLGVAPNGTAAAPNNWPAMVIYNGFKTATVGGATAADRNVISGGTSCGVLTQNPGTDGVVIKGNYFGTTADGAAKLANGDWNVAILNGTKNVTIGGTAAGEGNVISGDTYVGIGLSDAGTANISILGNRIGTNAAGTAAVGNQIGILSRPGPTGIVIGGTATGAGNLISGNTNDGISLRGVDGVKVLGNRIGTNATGTSAIPNQNWGISVIQASTNCQIGGTAAGEGNLISGNQYIDLGIGNAGTTGNQVLGNYIGTNAAGDAAIAQNYGVYIFDNSLNNIVGGPSPSARNVISGHSSNGVQVNDLTCTGNVIQGNYIGTNASGLAAIATPGWGIYCGGKNTSILGNVVSGNGNVGIGLGNGATANTVQGNIVGLAANGTSAIPNANVGIDVYGGSTNNTIGGAAATERNVVAANNNTGILIIESGSNGNKVLGNYVGMTADGSAARPNLYDGIAIAGGAKNNVIGGTTTSGGNVIGSSGSSTNSSGAGIACYDAGTSGNTITGNIIGALSSDFTCGWCGVALTNGATGNVIGGITAGAGNRIFNNGAGVYVNGASTTGNAIRGNAIGSNTNLGINLAANDGSFGVTANDTGDGDSGPNNLQNFPVITSATNSNGSTTIQATLNSKPSQTYNVDFYASESADPSTYGEGVTYLGSKSVTTDATGNASFSVTLAHTSGGNLTATATSSTGDTSEFGKAFFTTINANLPVSGTVTLQDFGGAVTGLTATVEIRTAGTTTVVDSRQVTLTSTGTFTSNAAITPGTYDVTVKVGHWLRKKTVNVSVTSSGVSGLSFSLRNGDVNGDNKVDNADQTALTAAFRSKPSSANWNANADLNGDGQVSASDQAVLGKNYGAAGD